MQIQPTPLIVRLGVLLLISICFVLAPVSQAQDTGTESPASKGEFLGAMESVYPDWFKVSFLELEDDVAEAAEAGKRLMLLFHQDGCPYCNAFVERNLAQKDIEDTLKEKFDVIEINMWGDREVASVGGNVYTEKTFAEALRVQFTPTILFLNEQGSLALRINGYYDPDRFRLVLDYVSNKREKEKTFDEFMREQTPEETQKEIVSHPYITGPVTELATRPGSGDKPLLLLFEQGNCRNCETLHKDIFSLEESQALLEEFDVYQIDMWGRDAFTLPDGTTTTGRDWSRTLGISYAPTLITFAADGTEVIRSEAWFKRFHTQSILHYVLSDEWREQPNFQRYLSDRAEHIREQGIDVNIFD
ncbi:MAG: thioredoxin fold domain-containing protein [Granulosicoccus sp.]|nr:thioredoxin fold domain-containing protein [Granulosicoccus sp.]